MISATVYALVLTTNLQIHIVTCCIHLRIHHTSRILYLFQSFSDFVVQVVTTLIFTKNRRQCARFSINMAILFLSFQRATTVLNKLIDRQHYKWLRSKTLIAFYSLSHFTLTTARLNLSFLQTLNDWYYLYATSTLHSKLTKTQATFWSEFNFKPVTNLELSNALIHNAKLVLSFITRRKCRNPRDPLRSLIPLRSPRYKKVIHW